MTARYTTSGYCINLNISSVDQQVKMAVSSGIVADPQSVSFDWTGRKEVERGSIFSAFS